MGLDEYLLAQADAHDNRGYNDAKIWLIAAGGEIFFSSADEQQAADYFTSLCNAPYEEEVLELGWVGDNDFHSSEPANTYKLMEIIKTKEPWTYTPP